MRVTSEVESTNNTDQNIQCAQYGSARESYLGVTS